MTDFVIPRDLEGKIVGIELMGGKIMTGRLEYAHLTALGLAILDDNGEPSVTVYVNPNLICAIGEMPKEVEEGT